MVLDAGAIATGIASSIVSERAKAPIDSAINDALGIDKGKTEADILAEIHELLVLFYKQMREQFSNSEDVYKFITIWKNGLGSQYQPSHSGNRQHFQIFGASAVLLNVTAPGLGAFNLTTVAAGWLNTDLPDGTGYYLDASVSTNSVTFWQRETDASVT